MDDLREPSVDAEEAPRRPQEDPKEATVNGVVAAAFDKVLKSEPLTSVMGQMTKLDKLENKLLPSFHVQSAFYNQP
ncbi:unnamed protein product [Merluccius merluccius]